MQGGLDYVWLRFRGSWGSRCFFSRCLWLKWWITSPFPIFIQLPALPLPSLCPLPLFFLLLLFCREMNRPPVCCIRISLCQTPLCIWCWWFMRMCVCVLSVCMCIHRIGFWDLECVFVLVFAGVYLARSFSTLHAGLEQADKLFAKTGN